MKKRLNVDQIQSELRGGSAFFPGYKGGGDSPTAPSQEPEPAGASPGVDAPPHQDSHASPPPPAQHTSDGDTMTPRHHDTTIPRNHDTTTPGYDQEILEVVRKAVKQLGKEAATHRFTVEEKNHLAEIEYTYKRQGIRTSENELTRIAINYFLEDYRRNGEQSLLATILKRLNS